MTTRSATRLLLAGLAMSAAAAGCRHPEQPTVPPVPVNPTNQSIAYDRADVIDASIVSDAAKNLDASIGSFDVATAATVTATPTVTRP